MKNFKSKNENGKLKAFTLAEVLITLVIIGIIGALTVPSLIQRTQKQEYVSALKKAYSTLSQATQEIIMEEGSPKCDEGGWACSADEIYNLYKSKLNIVKDCGSASGCIPQRHSSTDTPFIYLNKVIPGNWDTRQDLRKIVLADGMQITFEFMSQECSWPQGSEHWQGSKNDICALIGIDVNGTKGPNIVGRDYFSLGIRENGVFPIGCDIDYCIGKEGSGCACKVLREGAMNY